MRSENGFRPVALVCWAAASIITAISLCVLFVLAVTLWVGYTHRELHGSWIAMATATVLIPACLYAWLKALKACIRKAKRPELLEP
jgi:apolipoprotein N-acyltransferase